MCSYNRINDTYACENNQTLNVDLKQRMGFQGWVMSDWGATHSTVKAANSGLDQQMPDGGFFGSALASAISNGQVPQSRLEDMVLRILTPMFAVGLFDNPQTGDINADVQNPAHVTLTRNLAAAATVLLKNDAQLLPLNVSHITKIAVIGDDGNDLPVATGRGSGGVNLPYIVTPWYGIRNRVGNNIQVSYANSKSAEVAANARAADVAIVFVGTTSSEGSDRGNLGLGNAQDDLVTTVANAQKNTIVVVHTPGAALMPWASKVSAIICAFLPGQEDGSAIASVLFGDVNPSGKLPVTFPASNDQTPINTPAQYPGVNGQSAYSEGLLVGYRWYDAKNQEPLFEFGHGLSYTTFSFSNLQVTGSARSTLTVSFTLTNTGKVSGAEIPQLYVGYPANAGEPPKVLRAFRKVNLNKGESQTVSFILHQVDFSIWDVTKHDWALSTGEFTFYVGSSSRDIRLKAVQTVQ